MTGFRFWLRCWNVLKKIMRRLSGPAAFPEWVEEYNKLLANRNQPVRILDPNQPWEGTALGINEQGELLVKDEQGIIQTVRAGEVSVRGLYSYV